MGNLILSSLQNPTKTRVNAFCSLTEEDKRRWGRKVEMDWEEELEEGGNAKEESWDAVWQKHNAGWLDNWKIRSKNEEKEKKENVKDSHIWPHVVCLSLQQQLVQTGNDGKPVRRLGEVPHPLTLSERNSSQQEKKGVWDRRKQSRQKPGNTPSPLFSESGRMW